MSVESKSQPRHSLAIFGGYHPPNKGTLYRTSTLLWLAGIALLTVPMVTLVDVSVARWVAAHQPPREISDALDIMRIVSHGWGIFLVMAAIMLMAPTRRWHIPRLVALAMGGGAVATLAKMFVLRPRPNSMNLDIASYDSAWLWAFDWNLEHIAAFDASTRAFPSSNLATATALTVGLWLVLPRGRYLFAIVWCGAFLQRLNCGSHYISDLFGGTAFGLLWSYTCLHPKLLGSLFDKMQPEEDRRQRYRRDEDNASSDPPTESDSEETEPIAA